MSHRDEYDKEFHKNKNLEKHTVVHSGHTTHISREGAKKRTMVANKMKSKATDFDRAFSRHGEHLTDEEHENSLNKYFAQRKRRKS